MNAWFETPHLLTIRPASGAAGLALVVENAADGAVGRIWREDPDRISDVLPVPAGLTSLLTVDGEWIVDLDDDGGSEVGRLWARSVDGAEAIDLTPDLGPYVLRGLEMSSDGSALVATIVDDDGYHVIVLPARPWGPHRVVYSSPYEAWYGHVAADARLVSVDSTSHNPNVRRPAVTVIDVGSGDEVAVLDDLPAGPVRAVRFSRESGDPRLLVATERSGFNRPVIWDPRTNERRDFDLQGLSGEVIPLDWHSASGRVLALHVEEGIQRLLLLSEHTDEVETVSDAPGSYADPDVANVFAYYWNSYLGRDGSTVVVTSRWDTPIHVFRKTGGETQTVISPPSVPPGRTLRSEMVVSKDGTAVQLWLGLPEGEPRGTVLEVHGGPNLVTVDGYSPSAQSWIASGFAYASLNYRGSVTFGRAFREGFWGVGSDREIEDVTAAVQRLREHGLADPATSFITGPSFGGHLTLLSLGRLPDAFAGGLAHVAMADWSAAWADMNPALRGAWTAFLGGTPDQVPDVVARMSAVNHVDHVVGSAWLNQGMRDTRTPAAQAQRYADLLRDAGGDVVVDWFDAGHEPTGLGAMAHDQERMLELVERTLTGRPWAE